MNKEQILFRIQRRVKENETRNQDIDAYDSIDDMKWTLPWTTESWIRKRVSSVGHNGLKTVLNLFNTYNPKWELVPRGPKDNDAAEELESWLSWEMEMTNLHGAQEPFRKMLKYAAKYGIVAAQLEYLPYWMPEGDEKNSMLMNGAFCINVHSPRDIHYEISKYGAPRWVAQVSNVDSAYILDQWEQYRDNPDHPGIGDALDRVSEFVNGQEQEQQFIYVDYTDKEKRWVFCSHLGTITSLRTDDLLRMGESRIDIFDAPNDLPFVNWVITEVTGDPLFKSMHYSGSWENQNFLETLADSTVIRRAFFPILRHQSATGEDLDVDYSGIEATIEERPGDQTQVLNPPPLDRGISELQDRNTANMSQDLGVRGLQQTDITGNIQFATVNAQIQLGKTVMDPQIRAFERACVQLGKLAFWWVKVSGDTVTSYRTKTKKGKVRGTKINVKPEDFDPHTIMIRCELLANTPTDDMQRWNIFSGMKQGGLQIPDSEFIERMEMGDPETLKNRWLEEQIFNNAVQLFFEQKRGELQLQLSQIAQGQQAQNQAAQAAAQGPQGQAQPPQGPPTPMLDQAQGQGFNTGQGGSSPAEMAPQATQTALRQ